MVITTTATNLQNNFERYLKNFQEKTKICYGTADTR